MRMDGKTGSKPITPFHFRLLLNYHHTIRRSRRFLPIVFIAFSGRLTVFRVYETDLHRHSKFYSALLEWDSDGAAGLSIQRKRLHSHIEIVVLREFFYIFF